MHKNEGREEESCERPLPVMCSTGQREGYPIRAKVTGDAHHPRLGY